MGDVESVKAVSEVLSPVSGTVTAVNEALAATPEAINADPYGAWLIEVNNVTAFAELMDAAAYEAFCANA
jgi:glycine cleavage system H protein